MNEERATKALVARANDIDQLCKSVIKNEDQYIEACSFIALLLRLQHRTEVQQKLLDSLVNLVSPYEEKHYPYGN